LSEFIRSFVHSLICSFAKLFHSSAHSQQNSSEVTKPEISVLGTHVKHCHYKDHLERRLLLTNSSLNSAPQIYWSESGILEFWNSAHELR